MKKDDILNASRKEHKNKDLAEIEVIYQAGSHAGRVGALVCCLLSLLSSMLAHAMIYSPWVIYFSILSTQWLVRFIKMKRKSDLVLTILFLILSEYERAVASEKSLKGSSYGSKSFSSTACRNGGCVEKHYQFYRNRAIQPNSKVSSYPLHCLR